MVGREQRFRSSISINLVLYGLIGPFAATVYEQLGIRRTMVFATLTAGTMRTVLGTYMQAFILSGVLCIIAPLFVLRMGQNPVSGKSQPVATLF